MDMPEKLRKSTILIVDHLRAMRRILRYTFRVHKCGKVLLASSENEATHIINTETIDLILTEWMMPKESGLSFVKWIRAQESERPIIMVTTMSSKEDVLEARDAGINDYILKPLVPKEVMQKAIRQLEQRKMRKLLNETETHG